MIKKMPAPEVSVHLKKKCPPDPGLHKMEIKGAGKI